MLDVALSLHPAHRPEVTGGDDALVQRGAAHRSGALVGFDGVAGAESPSKSGRAGTPLPNDLIQREDGRYLIMKVP